MRSVASVRRPATISSQTESISVSVNGGPPQIFNTSGCTNNGGNLTCTLSVGATYGLDSFLILTYSGPNATGTVLNAASITLSVSASGPNTASAVAGTVITVNNSADGSGSSYSCAGGSTTCTLREAIAEASATAGVVTAILFASSISTITLAQANGQIQIADNQTIEILGPGASAANSAGVGAPTASGNLTINGGGNTGIFYVNPMGSLTVTGLTLTGGNNSDTYGGAIENYGTLAIVNAVFNANGGNNTQYGGAVYDQSNVPATTTVVASTFSNNMSSYEGGAYYIEEFTTTGVGGAAFSQCLFTNNQAFDGSDGSGGAIYADWNLSVTSSTFTGNLAGAISSASTYGEGGAINIDYNNQSPTITNSTFGGSTASLGNFAGGLASNAQAYGGAIENDGDNPLVLSGNTFSNNVAKGGDYAYGGAINDYEGITSTGDTFTNNVADSTAATSDGYASGGAVSTDWLTSWTNDTFTANQALGGKNSSGAPYGEAYGGAIDADYGEDPVAQAPFFVASQTTFSNNSGSASEYCDGGALFTYYNTTSSAQYVLSNVQFSNNSCTATNASYYAFAYGGAYFADYAPLSLLNVTFTGNTATATGPTGSYYSSALGGGLEYYDGFSTGGKSVTRRPAPDSATRSLAAIIAKHARLATQRAHAYAIKTLRANHKAKLAVQPVIHGRTALTTARRTVQSGAPTDGLASVTFTNNTVTATGYQAGSYGGGLDISGKPALTAITLTTNTALASGSNSYAGGGGLSNGGDYCGQNASFSGTATGNLATNAGGGVYTDCNAFTISNATISNNRVANAQYNGDGGGGIWTGYNTSGVNFTQLTVNGNTVAASSPIAGTGGGGIMNYDGVLTLVNATIFGNQSAIDGGGFENDVGESSAQASLVNVTVYQNTALGSGGSVMNKFNSGNNVVTIENSIFAGGSAPAGPEIANLDTFVSWGGNLIQGTVSGNAIPAASQGIADLLGVSPALASAGLASNGGSTQTIADTSSSPGKAHIPFSGGVCGYSGPSVDQRNFARGAGGFCDIGAFEFAGVSSGSP
ncbi:MAG: hypothetical protein JO101_01475 [Candidatus Eremiobacteraeota bacterium]|nr:hypothetical protein [Candidatus Eremiobacteraeota bacterium]